MYSDFAITKSPGKLSSIELKSVYYVLADKSYDIRRTETGRTGFIALRTIHGYGTLFIEGSSPLLVEPESLIFFENELVTKYYCSGDSWAFWWFEISLLGMIDFPLNQVIKLDMVPKENDDCKTCLEMLKFNNNISNCIASSTISTLFYKWLLQYQNITLEYRPYRSAIHQLIYKMKSDTDTPMKVKEMADLMSLSERRFRQIFEGITGVSPKKFYDNLRIEQAEYLLINTPFSVSEISYKLGYSSPFHFSKAFSKVNGVAPSVYRI